MLKSKALYIIMIPFLLLFFSLSLSASDDDYYIYQQDDIVEAGTYNVVLRDETGEYTKKIRITILYPRTVENKVLFEVIDARDIRLEKNTFEKLSDDEIIQLTNARAWNQKTNAPIPVSIAERKVVNKKNGLYEIVFSTQNGTSTTINVTEMEVLVVPPTHAYDNISDFDLSSNYTLLTIILVLFPLLLLLILLIITYDRKKKYQKLLYGERK